MIRHYVALAALALVAAACQLPQPPTTTTPESVRPATTETNSTTPPVLPAADPSYPMPAPGACHAGQSNGQPLPDPVCTPGAINPAVTQATITTTICKSGWTKTVRPPVNVTNAWKAKSMAAYSVSGASEYDHLVSLELGGAPLDTRNLWPEPGSVPNPKDKVENKLNAAVCSGQVTLAAAQQAIASDWTTALQTLGVS